MPRKRTRSDADAGVPDRGAGRRENVGESGVYPTAGADTPDDAVLRHAGERGEGTGGTEGRRSELYFTGEELKELRAGGSPDTEDR